MLGIGSVTGFFVSVLRSIFFPLIHPSSNSGNIDLLHNLPFLGNSQLQVLSVIVSLLLLAGHLIMAGLVEERVLVKDSSIDR